MDTQQIKNYLVEISPYLMHNVFAANRIPLNVSRPFFAVVNLDPDSKPGSHWVAISIDSNGLGEYFDSYGRNASSYHKSFLARNCHNWYYNSKILQNYFTTVCGEYCLVYLYFKFKGLSMKTFLNLFTEETMFNDLLVREMFNSIF